MTGFLDDVGGALTDAGAGAVKGLVTGGPVGALIGAVTGVLPDIGSAIFGKNGSTVMASVQSAVSQVTGNASPTAADVAGLTPDQQAQLRAQLAQIAATEEQSARAEQVALLTSQLGDVQSARQQTVALAAAKSSAQWGAPVVSILVLATFGTVMFLALDHQLPPGNETMLNMLMGSLAAMASSVVAYWVGSSAGSQAKNALLANSVPYTPPAAK